MQGQVLVASGAYSIPQLSQGILYTNRIETQVCVCERSVTRLRVLSIQREIGLVREGAVEERRSLIARKKEASTPL